MNSLQNKKTREFEKPFPGCLGRMVKFFDLSVGVAGNKMLTDKPCHSGAGLSRGQSDATRISPIGDALDDEMVVSELTRSSSIRKRDGTSVKMLIAQEMSKEVELKHNSPNLVAKLMGLDNLPQGQPSSAAKRSPSRSHSGSNIGISLDYWQQDHGSYMQMKPETHHWDQNGYRDFLDTRRPLRWECYVRKKPPEKGRLAEVSNEKKIALVRQKFAEAKRLAKDVKLQQSKQYQDASEVLSSNRGLFLKLMQEPKSMFSQYLPGQHSNFLSPETKHITVLRASKMLDDNQIHRSGKMNGKQAKKTSHRGPVNGLDKRIDAFSPPRGRVNNSLSQPTRIVVLKPSSKLHDTKAVVSPVYSPPRTLHGGESYGESPDDDLLGSREVAKEITLQLQKTLGGYQREEESLVSSIFSNGYTGDESSFHKSENGCGLVNISDSEVLSPTSRHSWDYIHWFESPYSSSFGHASDSPESSVCREAKKRLSERWALMASNKNSDKQRHGRRNSSTLGEMLALSDSRDFARSEDGISREQEMREPSSCSSTNVNLNINDSLSSFLRSKSVPASSTVFVEGLDKNSDDVACRTDISKDAAKTSNLKSSLKGKFSSLFSRNKRSSKDKSSASSSKNESRRFAETLVIDMTSKGDCTIQEDSARNSQGSLGKTLSRDQTGMDRKQILTSPQLSSTKPSAPGNLNENQDQPSPISVLEPPFEEDENSTIDSSNAETDRHGGTLLARSMNYSLIDKSPPIESIARTLSWDDHCLDTATSCLLKPLRVSQGTGEEEQELLFFVKSLLSVAGLDGEVGPNSLIARWHSPKSPLDISLRDSYIDLSEKESMYEPDRRRRRSTAKLVFDCVNAALAEIVAHGSGGPCNGVQTILPQCVPSSVMDAVCVHVKDWFPCEVPNFFGDDFDSSSLMAEATVRKEVSGNFWTEHMRLERDYVAKDIGVKMLEELVQELIVESVNVHM